jgi:integrase
VRSGFKKELLALERYKEENIRMVFFDAEDFAKFTAHLPRGCARYPRDFRTAWRSALEKAKVKEYRFHDFRRTATCNMALAGVPEKHIMQVTGHKTTAMLKRDNITVEQDIHNTLVRT